MPLQGNRMLIDIRITDAHASGNLDSHILDRPVRYLALDERGLIRSDKTYNKSTQQNSIDFINHLMAHVTMSIHIICTDNGLAFQGEFERHLAKLGLRHERFSPSAGSKR
jgi:hypothetical protein